MDFGEKRMLRRGVQRWELYRGEKCRDCQPFAGLRDLAAARRWLQQFQNDVLSMTAMRGFVSRERSRTWQLDAMTDDQVIDQMADLLSSGLWHVHTPQHLGPQYTQAPYAGSDAAKTSDKGGEVAKSAAQRAGSTAGKAAAALAPEKTSKPASAPPATSVASGTAVPPPAELTWIEIVLVDADGQPVPGMAYEIKLPDGTVQPGSLDANGKARHEQIVPGQCQVKFPELDATEWKPV